MKHEHPYDLVNKAQTADLRTQAERLLFAIQNEMDDVIIVPQPPVKSGVAVALERVIDFVNPSAQTLKKRAIAKIMWRDRHRHGWRRQIHDSVDSTKQMRGVFKRAAAIVLTGVALAGASVYSGVKVKDLSPLYKKEAYSKKPVMMSYSDVMKMHARTEALRTGAARLSQN